MTSAQLIPMHIWRVFAKKYESGRALHNNRLMQAIDKYPGFVVNGEDYLPDTSRVARAATKRRREGLTEVRLEAITSTLESYFPHPKLLPCNVRRMGNESQI